MTRKRELGPTLKFTIGVFLTVIARREQTLSPDVWQVSFLLRVHTFGGFPNSQPSREALTSQKIRQRTITY
jgi:hypothetical protein